MLNLDPVVQVNVNVGLSAITSDAYGIGLILTTPNTTLTATVRAVVCSSLADVVEQGYLPASGTGQDAVAAAPAYLAAERYFAETPTPSKLVLGVVADGETVATALEAIRDVYQNWYGVYMTGATLANIVSIDTYLNSIGHGIVFGTIDGAVSGLNVNSNLVALADTKRTCLLYSTTALEAASVMGKAMGLAGTHTDTTWQLCYKQIAGLTPASSLTQADVNTVEGLNLNVYVTRAYTHNLFEKGATIGGLRVDEVIALDRLSNDLKEALLSLIAGQTAKMPQNDVTTTRFMSAIQEVLERYRTIGYVQEGIWHKNAVGNVSTGDALERGYSMWADSFDNQTEAARRNREGMPIHVAVIFCGSVESIVLNVVVQE